MHGFYTSDWKSGEICSSHRGMGAGLGTRQALIKAHWQSCTAVGHKDSTSWTGQTDNWLEGTPIIPKISEETTERIVSVLGCKKKKKVFQSCQHSGWWQAVCARNNTQISSKSLLHDPWWITSCFKVIYFKRHAFVSVTVFPAWSITLEMSGQHSLGGDQRLHRMSDYDSRYLRGKERE